MLVSAKQPFSFEMVISPRAIVCERPDALHQFFPVLRCKSVIAYMNYRAPCFCPCNLPQQLNRCIRDKMHGECSACFRFDDIQVFQRFRTLSDNAHDCLHIFYCVTVCECALYEMTETVRLSHSETIVVHPVCKVSLQVSFQFLNRALVVSFPDRL